MHNGCKNDWLETASLIPEVQSALDSGVSLDDLLKDERIGKCVAAYFNPNSSKTIRVEEMEGGGYLFLEDGRHRVIAARMLGHTIPVKIVGIRK